MNTLIMLITGGESLIDKRQHLAQFGGRAAGAACRRSARRAAVTEVVVGVATLGFVEVPDAAEGVIVEGLKHAGKGGYRRPHLIGVEHHVGRRVSAHPTPELHAVPPPVQQRALALPPTPATGRRSGWPLWTGPAGAPPDRCLH